VFDELAATPVEGRIFTGPGLTALRVAANAALSARTQYPTFLHSSLARSQLKLSMARAAIHTAINTIRSRAIGWKPPNTATHARLAAMPTMIHLIFVGIIRDLPALGHVFSRYDGEGTRDFTTFGKCRGTPLLRFSVIPPAGNDVVAVEVPSLLSTS